MMVESQLRRTYTIEGMDCAEEVAVLRRELGPLPGVSDLSFDALNGRMTLTLNSDETAETVIIERVLRTGMVAQPWNERAVPDQAHAVNIRRGRTILTVSSGLLLAAGLLLDIAVRGLSNVFQASEASAVPMGARALYVAALICGAWHVFPKAWLAIKRLRPDMNLLMMVAVLGALAIGEYLEAATVAFLFAISLALEAWSIERARNAIRALMAITPNTARVKEPAGTERDVAVTEVSVGASVIVKPGEKFPLDGRITRGETTVNQAPITGESMPVAKSPGSEVFAGTINEDGAVEFVTTKPASDTTLARITRLVGDAQSKRSPSEQWVERFAAYYTPAVMVLALVIMVIPPLITGGHWSRWFYEGLVLLVIACPCALVISTPVTIVAALASAAKNGVLVKGGPFIEAPAKLAAIAFDKTGTLTQGRPEVRKVIPLSGHTENEVLELAAAVEMRSEHPLARAIIRAANDRGIRPTPVENYRAIKGKGATATLDGRELWLGSHRLLEERGQESLEMHQTLEKLERDGSSVIVIGENEHVCGLIAVRDQLRPGAKATIQSLRDLGVKHLVMLTGDNRGTAEVVGRETGVNEIRAELLPEDKVAAIEELVKQFGTVAMIGDGVNDAPAMARATLGIAMGTGGTDAALETADIALMTDDLSRVAWLIHHARRCLRVIHQNIALSLGVKGIFMVLTLMGTASLWTAIAADMGASLLVTFNGLRLLNSRVAPIAVSEHV